VVKVRYDDRELALLSAAAERAGLTVAGFLAGAGLAVAGEGPPPSQVADRELLAALADAIRGLLRENGIVLLASSEGPAHVALVMAATPNLAKRIHAGQLLKAISPLTKGSGGGRPEFAQAGGKDPAGIPAALKRAEELVREALEK
jgi:alanyl-tRNA synthetase